MDKIEVVIVTGMSGAGKTQAMAIFENMEYLYIFVFFHQYHLLNFLYYMILQFVYLIVYDS